MTHSSSLVPEKRKLVHGVNSSISTQFWNQCTESTRTVEGLVTEAPSEPAALRVVQPSGVSRSQIMQASQAVGIPVQPCYCAEHGGLVVDRAMSMLGLKNCWVAAVGRVKVQEMLRKRQRSGVINAVLDPKMFVMHALLRSKPTRNTSIKASLQADSLAALLPLLVSPGRMSSNPEHAISASAQLSHKAFGHAITAKLSANEIQISSPALYHKAPLTATLDLEPLPSRTSPLLYRVGMHQTAALRSTPAEPGRSGGQASDEDDTAEGAGEAGADRWELQTRLQAGLAVHGSKLLWQSQKREGLDTVNEADLNLGDGAGGNMATAGVTTSAARQGSVKGASSAGDEGRLITAEDVQELLVQSAATLRGTQRQLKEGVAWVAGGGFREQLQGRGAPQGDAGGRQRWSSFLAGPQLQVAGALGAVTKASFSNTGGLKLPTLAPFASGAASLQLGNFSRAVLDFTRLTAQLDLGLPSPIIVPGTLHLRQPALPPVHTNANGGTWHAATFSLSQQLFGPVRLCADWRVALDSGSSLGPWRSHPLQHAERVVKHVQALRPSLLDSAYALDVAVPGSKGLARVVAWYAPVRGEGMVELRLM